MILVLASVVKSIYDIQVYVQNLLFDRYLSSVLVAYDTVQAKGTFATHPFLDIFLPIDSYLFAPLNFPHSCRIQTHSSTTTSNHRQVVLKVWWPKNCQKSSYKGEKKGDKISEALFLSLSHPETRL